MPTVSVPDKDMPPFQHRARRAAMLVCVFVTMLSIPFGIRVENAARGVKSPASTYLPAYESSRQHAVAI